MPLIRSALTEDHISFTAAQDLQNICRPLFQSSLITAFWHGMFNHETLENTIITTTPECNKAVYDAGLLPVGEELTIGVHYLALNECSKNRLEINKAYQLNNLLEIVENKGPISRIYGFSTTIADPGVVNHFFNNLDFFNKFILNFKDQAAGLIKKAESDLVKFEPVDQSSLEYAKQNRINSEPHLTVRELHVLWGIRQGWSAKMIGKALNLSPRTVESYSANIKEKIGASNKAELIRFCLENGHLLNFPQQQK